MSGTVKKVGKIGGEVTSAFVGGGIGETAKAVRGIIPTPAMPGVAPVPPSAPGTDAASRTAISAAAEEERRRRTLAGRAATLLTGGTGLLSSANVAHRALTGD